MDVKNSKEMLVFVDGIVDGMIEAKADDGKISKFEIAKVTLENLPAGIKALMGADKIDDELKELSPEERDELLGMAMPILKKLAGLVL